MVRGVSEDFWSTFVDPDPTNPKKRVVTVWGQGAVNVNTANAQTLLGVVCAGAPTADICTNADQAALFLTGVTMARGITMGAPMFGNTRDFVQALTGQGQLGPLLAAIGMKPVVFKSQAEFQKSITHREQDVLDLRRRREEGLPPRDARAAPRGRRLPKRAEPRQRPAPHREPARRDVRGAHGGRRPPPRRLHRPTPTRSPPPTRPSTGGTVVYYRVQ